MKVIFCGCTARFASDLVRNPPKQVFSRHSSNYPQVCTSSVFLKQEFQLFSVDICRYYNSWIEITDDAAHSDTSSSFSGTPRLSESEKKVSLPQDFKKNSLDLTDDIEKFAPQVAEASTDFSISYEVNIPFLCKSIISRKPFLFFFPCKRSNRVYGKL